MKIVHNRQAPHVAAIFINTEVHEKMPTGELTGNPVYETKAILSIEGVDFDLCIRKLNDFIEEMKQCSKTK